MDMARSVVVEKMFYRRHLFVGSVAMVMALCFFQKGECEGPTYASLTSDSEMSTWHQSMPPSMYLNITLDDNDLQLSLQQDEDAHPDIPMIELVPGVDGVLRLQRVPMAREKAFALYHDVQHTAAFRVSIHANNKERPPLSIVGIIHSRAKLYDIRSTTLQFVTSMRTRRGGVDTQKELLYSHKVLFEVNVLNSTTHDSYGAIPNQYPLLHLRQKRQEVTQDINVDVVAFIDYEIYRRWYSSSVATSPAARHQDTLDKIYSYYTFVFSGMNMLYKTITSLKINVRLVNMVVSSNASSSSWTELNKKTGPSNFNFHVDASTILENFTNWASLNKVPTNDHLMLFTGYEVSRNYGTDISISGLAYVGTLCTGSQQTSIVEDRGGFQCIGTAAHELGHSLSAQHDGTNNSCKAEDRYIMSPATYNETVSNKFNPWLFSSCSVYYFNNFITSKMSNGITHQCLTEALTVIPSIPDVSSLMLGQVYDAHQQCQQVYGQLSYFCQLFANSEVMDVCLNLYCYNPTTTLCDPLRSAPGTSCGNKKWCMNGQCTYDVKAPARDDTCIFGDRPGVYFDNKNCNTLISEFPGYCYESQTRILCCQSCAKFRQDVQNCEYRDRNLGCIKQYCAYTPRNYTEECCYTCGSSSNANTLFIPRIAVFTAAIVLSL